jgi:hypothetical protein
MMMAGITSETRENAWRFIFEMAKQISPGNTDGLGYAAMTTEGDLFGERWLFNGEAFFNRETEAPLSEREADILSTYRGALRKEQRPIRYNKFGVLSDTGMAAITLHTRMATSGKGFENTHPFVSNGVSLIHNGVISNAHRLEMKQSTCDSETILNLYVKNNVAEKPALIQAVAKRLQGYYACGVLGKSEKDGVFLDIFKCVRANLEAAYVKELQTVVFSTRLADIKTVCEKLGFTVSGEFVFESNTLLRLDALTGTVISVQKFKQPEIKIRKRPSISEGLPRVSKAWVEEEAEERYPLYQGRSWLKGGLE